jgi:hypothetical protein
LQKQKKPATETCGGRTESGEYQSRFPFHESVRLPVPTLETMNLARRRNDGGL